MIGPTGVPAPAAWNEPPGLEHLRPIRPPPVTSPSRLNRGRSVETSGRVGEHGVDLAGLRGEVGARNHLTAIVTGDLVEQALELADVTIDGLHEFAVAAIFPADFVKGALAL